MYSQMISILYCHFNFSYSITKCNFCYFVLKLYFDYCFINFSFTVKIVRINLII